jgi:hydrogenase maturation protein HypF
LENTWHIYLKGQVQGVGFRPFVHFKAKTFGLTGWVSNTTDGVRLEFNAEKEKAFDFYNELLTEAPTLSKITGHQISKIPKQKFGDFRVVFKHPETKPDLMITPDFAICDTCTTELLAMENKRYCYPFTSCTNCGPRFSILQKLPYDRENTAMSAFQMCSKCDQEYNNIENRRYFSQTNSCPDCAIKLHLYDAKDVIISRNPNQIIEVVVHHWEQGKIVAIKGIGGYLLTCDAANTEAIAMLRKQKHRPNKPFAVMYPNVKVLEHDVILTSLEIAALRSAIAPIVLCKKRKGAKAIDNKLIAPNTNRLGVMLSYTPLFKLLLQKFGRPIIATSGNISNSPILFEDDKMQFELSQVYDFRLSHNLKIAIPQDDSVLKYSKYEERRILIRRARGLAPNFFNEGLDLPQKIILATGASLKSTFCLHNGANTYVSQYLGSLEHFDTLKSYASTVEHFLDLLQCSPDIILSDLHPDYPSTQYGLQLSQYLNIPFLSVQHHLAHFAAVLGENRLQDSKVPILGVVWDGTGYGEDSQIWGGEFYVYKDYCFKREVHFDYFDAILGDKMPMEPRISALSCCFNIKGSGQLLQNKFSTTEWRIYQKKLGKTKNLKTSSVGRIFDAVASLLGLMDKQTFEGEAAMILEALAQDYFDKHNMQMDECYFSKKSYLNKIPTQELMSGIVNDIVDGKKKDFIAAKFHFSLMKLIWLLAEKLKIKHIAFSGGVFQNGLLVDLILIHLKKDFDLYFNKDLSPNDENISFGQLMFYNIKNHKK